MKLCPISYSPECFRNERRQSGHSVNWWNGFVVVMFKESQVEPLFWVLVLPLPLIEGPWASNLTSSETAPVCKLRRLD